MTTIVVHSFKGGTGRSLIAVALAHSLSKEGKKVLLIDGDYEAPSLASFFPPRKKSKSFPDFLEGRAKLKDVITETSFPNLYVSYAPPPSLSEELLRADIISHGKYLQRLMDGFEAIKRTMDIDKIVIDNSSGVTLSAIDHLSSSNKSIMILRPMKYDSKPIHDLAETIYQKLRQVGSGREREDFIVWNQVPVLDDASFDQQIEDYLRYWTQKYEASEMSLAGIIPYISEVSSLMVTENAEALLTVLDLIRPYLDSIKKNIIR